MKKMYIQTWGCQMNVYDSEKITDLLTRVYKYKITKNVQEADLILLNTCSIRESPQEKLFHQLGRWKNLKKKKKSLIIGVGGCVATQEGENILKRANYVDIIFGPQTLHRIPRMIEKFKYTQNPVIDIRFLENEKFECFPDTKTSRFSAFVSIMEGCSKYCTYCIVPYTRGEEFSRPCDDILFEIFQLASQGVREIILLGQNVNAYRGLHYDGTICNFPDLIRLVSSIDGIQRIRYITSHPAEFTKDLIEVYRDVPQLVNFLHLPVQSGSDKILSMMKRSYSVSEYKSIVSNLKKARPNMQISSDFIVGFPNETKRDFQKTMELILKIDFDMSYSFIYSPRPGTSASEIKDSVKLEEKNIRLRLLQERIKIQTMKHTRRMKGTKQNILVEKVIDNNSGLLSGKTENNRIVNFYGSLSMVGQFVFVKITDASNNTLRADFLHS